YGNYLQYCHYGNDVTRSGLCCTHSWGSSLLFDDGSHCGRVMRLHAARGYPAQCNRLRFGVSEHGGYGFKRILDEYIINYIFDIVYLLCIAFDLGFGCRSILLEMTGIGISEFVLKLGSGYYFNSKWRKPKIGTKEGFNCLFNFQALWGPTCFPMSNMKLGPPIGLKASLCFEIVIKVFGKCALE